MKRRVFVVGTFIVVVAVVIATGYHSLTSSGDGSISPVSVMPDTTDNDTQRTMVQGAFGSFSYPAKFTPIGSDTPVPPIVGSYNFTKQQVGSWQISIQVTRLEGNSLDADGSYNFRNKTPMRFEKEQRTIGNNSAAIFSDTTSPTFAKTGYLQRGDLAVSFTVSGGTSGNTKQLQTDFDALIASWNWQ